MMSPSITIYSLGINTVFCKILITNSAIMELNELTVFVKVVQLASFSKAADALNLQSGYVSRVIMQLERKLGVRLLERTTRSLSLTEIGREVYERAIGILSAVEDTKRITQQLTTTPRGTLRLTCGVEFGLLAVEQWIQGFLSIYPEVNIETDWTGRVLDLVHEGFDIAIRIGELPDSSLVARPLGLIHYGLYASPLYLQQFGQSITHDSIHQCTRLVFSAGQDRSIWRLTDGGRELMVQSQPRLLSNNHFALRDSVIKGLGVALLPKLMAKPLVATGELLHLLPDWSAQPMPVHALYASNRYLTPKVRAFIDYALMHFPHHTIDILDQQVESFT